MKNKGSALLYTVLLLAILLTVIFGLSTLISAQFRIMTSAGNSVIAFYAADAGVERMIYEVIVKNTWPSDPFQLEGSFSNTATYIVTIRCQQHADFNKECGGIPIDTSCSATNFCIKSTGTYKDAKRALMVNI